MSKFRTMIVLLLGVVTFAWIAETSFAADPPSRKDLVKRMKNAQKYFKETVADPKTAIPKVILKKATGIVILWQFKVGLIIGAKGGNGIAMVMDELSKEWSPPAFVVTTEGSVGLQVGGQETNSIYVVMSKESMKKLLKGGVKLGIDLSAQVGPVGKDIQVDLQKAPEVFIYAKHKGLYTGAAFTVSAFESDQDANEIFYGKKVRAEDILFTKTVKMPAEANTFVKFLENY